MCHNPMHDHEAAAEADLDAALSEPAGSDEQAAALAAAQVEALLALAHAVNRMADQGEPMHVTATVDPSMFDATDAPFSVLSPEWFEQALEEAAEAGWRVSFDYEAENGESGRRTVMPVDVFPNKRGDAVLLGNDQARDDGFRAFRLDRMARLTVEAS